MKGRVPVLRWFMGMLSIVPGRRIAAAAAFMMDRQLPSIGLLPARAKASCNLHLHEHGLHQQVTDMLIYDLAPRSAVLGPLSWHQSSFPSEGICGKQTWIQSPGPDRHRLDGQQACQ